MKKIVVCGSRTFKNKAFLEKKLDELTKDLDRFELIFGACPLGADKMALDWFESRERGASCTTPFPANWSKYGYAAGPIHNREIAEYAGKDGICIGFWQCGSRGTMSMLNEAHNVGMQVVMYQEKDWENVDSSSSS